MINLVTFIKPTGGVASFTRHLAQVLGGPENVRLLRVGTTRRKRAYKGLDFVGVKPEEVPDDPTIVLVRPDEKAMFPAIDLMKRIPCIYVIHDPRCVYNSGVYDASKWARQVVVIREVNLKLKEGAVFCRHPYVRTGNPSAAKRTRHAISHSQVNFKKGQEIMLRANKLITDPARRIEVWGSGNAMSRMFVHHKLLPEFPDFVLRPFEDAVKLCETTKYDVDLTEFLGDGGGTQYTFLEAADACAVPILKSTWIKPGEVIQHGQNCWTVADEYELADMLMHEPTELSNASIIQNNHELLSQHDGSDWQYLVENYR